jgi:hypothetical protein
MQAAPRRRGRGAGADVVAYLGFFGAGWPVCAFASAFVCSTVVVRSPMSSIARVTVVVLPLGVVTVCCVDELVSTVAEPSVFGVVVVVSDVVRVTSAPLPLSVGVVVLVVVSVVEPAGGTSCDCAAVVNASKAAPAVNSAVFIVSSPVSQAVEFRRLRVGGHVASPAFRPD